MAKKQVGISLRKPPPAADVVEEGAPESRPLAKREEVTVSLSGGREYREVTVYLPQDLARRLAVHCMEKDRDTSNVLADVVREHLEMIDGMPQPVREEPELPPWQKVAQSIASMVRMRLGWT
jgi:hypothetical protein